MKTSSVCVRVCACERVRALTERYWNFSGLIEGKNLDCFHHRSITLRRCLGIVQPFVDDKQFKSKIHSVMSTRRRRGVILWHYRFIHVRFIHIFMQSAYIRIQTTYEKFYDFHLPSNRNTSWRWWYIIRHAV